MCVCVCVCMCEGVKTAAAAGPCVYVYVQGGGYRIAGKFGGKNIWRIAPIMAFGGFYFGGWVSLIP